MPKIVALKEDWIKLGFKLFSEKGESGLIVDKMSDKLACNRSSFYWHFKSKKAFIKEIVNYWVESDTNQIIALTENRGDPSEKFKALVKLTFRKDPDMDFVFYLKRYAIKNPDIQTIIDKVDQRRMDYVKDIFFQMGHGEHAEPMAKAFYKYLIGHHEMIRYKSQSRNYHEEVLKELKEFIHY